MSQEKYWRNYFDKAWDIQKLRKTKPLSPQELKTIALESGMSEDEWHEVQKAFHDYVARGKSYMKHKNWKDAIDEFDEAYKINAHDADLLLQLSIAHQQKYYARKWPQDARKAIQYAEECLEVSPTQTKATQIITKLRKGLAFQRKRWVRRGALLLLLFAIVGTVVYFWQPIQQEFKTDWAKVKEYFNKRKKGTAFVLQEVIFPLGQVTLSTEAKSELDRLVAYLKEHPQVRGEISGHTDNTGDRQANQLISEQRAKIVYDYLVQSGIAASRLEYKGYGDTQPKAPNTEAAMRAKNRRIEFKIL